MPNRTLPSIEKLRARIDYDPLTGIMLRKPRSRDEFKADRFFKNWNARFCGKIATSILKTGYSSVQLDSQNWLAHRVAFAIYHGRWPDGQIDHINGIRSDNRIENLREVSNSENSKNTGIRKNNSSGVVGVRFAPKNTGHPWVAVIKTDYQTVYLGSFVDKDSAVKARKLAEIEYGYHKNHGLRPAVPKEPAL